MVSTFSGKVNVLVPSRIKVIKVSMIQHGVNNF